MSLSYIHGPLSKSRRQRILGCCDNFLVKIMCVIAGGFLLIVFKPVNWQYLGHLLWLLRPLWPQSRRCLQGFRIIPIPRKDSIRKLIKKNEPNNLLLRKKKNRINRQTNFFSRNLNISDCICFTPCKNNGQLSICFVTHFYILGLPNLLSLKLLDKTQNLVCK